jgi:hypothetical protein
VHSPTGLFCSRLFLVSYDEFEVIRSSSLVSNVQFPHPVGIPDHSLLLWNICYEFDKGFEPVIDQQSHGQTKYLTNKIPETFLSENEVYNELMTVVDQLEQSVRTQECVNGACISLCKTIKNGMLDKIPSKTVHFGCSNKHRRVKKPW